MMPIAHRSEKLGLGLMIQYELKMRLSLWRALPWLVSVCPPGRNTKDTLVVAVQDAAKRVKERWKIKLGIQ